KTAMPVSSRPRRDNRSCAAPSTPGSVAGADRGGCAASERDSRCDLPLPTRPAGTPWHAHPPTLASPPAPRLSVAGCTDAAQTPLQPPGARARSGLFAPNNACGAVALASTLGATITRQPTGSTAGSWPSAPRLGGPSATKNRPGPRCRQVACEPCPKCLFSSAAHWPQATFQALPARCPTAPQPLLTSGGSSPPAARDAGCATHWRGAASRHYPPP